MADGQILINTLIDTSGIDIGVEDIKKGLKRFSSSMSGIKKVGGQTANQAVEAFAELNQQAELFEAQGVPTKAFVEIQRKIDAAKERLEGLIVKQEEFLKADGSGDSSYFQEVQKDIARVTAELKLGQEELQQLIANGKAFTLGTPQSKVQSVGGTGVMQVDAERQTANNRLKDSFQRLRTIVKEYRQSLEGASAYTGMLKSAIGGLGVVLRTPLVGLQNLSAALKKLPSAAVSAGIAGIRKSLTALSATIKFVIKNAQKAALALAQMVGKGIIGGLKKLSTGIFGLAKGTKKAHGGLGGLLGTSLLLGTAFMAFYAALNSIKEGMGNLARYSDETNATLSGLMSSLTQLKNSFATAFSPILTVAAPALQYLIGLLTTATTSVSRFMAAITGKDTYIRATKVQQDYAESLERTAGAAKEAEGALASFDKLNVTQDNLSAGGNGGGGELAPEDMFETVPLENSIKNMAELIKDLIKSEDWSGLGSYMADGINVGLQKIYDAINWENVGPKITYFVNAFASTFNSLVDNLNWELLGSTIGAGVNTIINTLLLLVDAIDWENLGKKFAQGVNGLVDEIDWGNLGRLLVAKINILAETLYGFVQELNWNQLGDSFGQGINGAVDSINPSIWAGSLSGLVKGLLDALYGLLVETDWQAIGNKIANFFANIDYSGIADSLFSGIGAALASLSEFLWGLIEGAWSKVSQWWQEVAYEDGQFTIEGLLNGIWEGVKNIGKWIYEHIAMPFINGFKDAFGIHSPSTVMAALAEDLMNGLLNKITDMIPNVIGKFSQMKESISTKWDEIKRIRPQNGVRFRGFFPHHGII